MTSLQVLFLVLILFPALLTLVTEYLNAKHVIPELPKEFADCYEAEKYRKSQEYLKKASGLAMIKQVFETALLLFYVFFGGYALLDSFAGVPGGVGLVHTLLFFLGIQVIQLLVSMPFSWYGTFVLEEEFGFNKSSQSTFFIDQIKGLFIGAILLVLLVSLVYQFFTHSGDFGWLFAWVAVMAVLLVVQVLAPTLILPLFNKFTPLEEGELKTGLEALASQENFKLKGLFKIDGSRRSSRGNAFFTGLGKWKRIALYDTLVDKHPAPELIAILAHEIGHYRKKHVLRSLIYSFASLGVMLFLLSLFLQNEALVLAAGFKELSFHAAATAFTILVVPLSMISRIFSSWMSRKHEYEADAFAARATGNAEDLVSGLKRLTVDNLGNLHPHRLKVALEYSHPPVLKRIEALRRG